MVSIQPRQEILLNAVSATATAIPTVRSAGVDGAGSLSLMIFAQNAAAGSALFQVQVSNKSDLGWVAYNRLIPNTALTASNENRTGTISQVGNGTAIYFIPGGDTFNFIRVLATDVWNGGNYTAVLYVN